MKKLYSLLLVVMALLMPKCLWAADFETFEVDGIVYEIGQTFSSMPGGVFVPEWYTVGVGGYRTNGPAISTETTGTVTIPETVTAPDGLPCKVVYIGKYAFSGCEKITRIILPAIIEGFGVGAFQNCKSLISVNIPEKVSEIEWGAFSGCSSLTSITLSSKISELPGNLFSGCSALESITIPASVSSIGYGVLQDCSSLKSIKVESGNTAYDSRNNCNAIIKTSTGELIAGCMNTVIPDGVTKIGDRSFSCCLNLTSINIPSTVTSIGYSAFSGCKSLTKIVIPNSVKTIDAQAFSQCDALTSAVLPNSLESIEANTFDKCFNLTSISIPGTVKTIGEKAFYGCKSLASITIPQSVTKIEYDSFWGMESCSSIKVENGNSVYDSRNNCNAIINTSTNELMLGCKNTIIPNTVTSIGRGAFVNCIGLKAIEIPSSVSTMGKEAFSGCTSLASAILPNSLTSISDQAFYKCSSLIFIDIPESITKIGMLAFYQCGSLTSVNIPNSVTSIGSSVFSGCTGLTKVSIHCKEIGNWFSRLDNIKEVEIGKEVTDIVGDAFSECTGLTAVHISDMVAWCNIVFKGTKANPLHNAHRLYLNGQEIKDLVVPNSVTQLKDYVFHGFSNMTSVSIPDNVTRIGLYAFRQCSGLTSVTIPGSVTSIGSDAFASCSGFKEVISNIEEPFAIYSSVFHKDTYNDVPLYVPHGTKAKYMSKGGWKNFVTIKEIGELDPIEGETTVNTENLSGDDLTDNVVGEVYYNVGDGGYDATDGSIVISETTNMGEIGDKKAGSTDVKNNFTGLILKVAKGKGVITVNVKTSGNAQLVVQVGNGTPMIASKTERGDVEIGYDVQEDTYVYIYAIIGSSNARVTRAASENEVRIYGITVSPGATTGITEMKWQTASTQYYSLDGQRQQGIPTQKGVYIVNGRKVVMK